MARIRTARAYFRISCLEESGLRRPSSLERVARRTTSKSYEGGLVRGLDIRRSQIHDTQGPDTSPEESDPPLWCAWVG